MLTDLNTRIDKGKLNIAKKIKFDPKRWRQKTKGKSQKVLNNFKLSQQPLKFI